MTTIQDGIEWGRTQIGKPYDSTWNNRFGPDAYDCSGFVIRVLERAGMPSGLLPTNSADMARWLRKNERYRLTRAEARATYGSLMIYGGVNGYGPAGHVGFSLGNGSTLEAASSNGVDVYSFDRIQWSDYFLAPQVNYGRPAPPPIPPPMIQEDDMVLLRGDKTPHVWLVNGPLKVHLTADTYPQWLFFLAGRPGAVDPTTRREWVVPQAMVDTLRDVASIPKV